MFKQFTLKLLYPFTKIPMLIFNRHAFNLLMSIIISFTILSSPKNIDLFSWLSFSIFILINFCIFTFFVNRKYIDYD